VAEAKAITPDIDGLMKYTYETFTAVLERLK
jgi:hypothetical protein